jgi:hypothetical protein
MIRMPDAVLVCAALFPVPLAWALLRMPAGEEIPLGTLVGYAALTLLSPLVWSLRWWVDDTGVERRTPFLPRLRLAWADVVSVKTTASECVLTGPGKVRARLIAGWRGYGYFAGKVLKHVPADRYLDETVRRELETKAWACSEVWDSYPTFSTEAAAPAHDAVRRWHGNPFFVLGLAPECTAADVERTGQKLLGLLTLDVASARTYASPFGPVSRTADDVRAAMAELRDPDRRIVHEVWARLPMPEETPGTGRATTSQAAARPTSSADEPGAFCWKGSITALGWRRP